MLKLKLLYFGNLKQKSLMLGKNECRRRRPTEDEMVGWHYWLNGREFEQTRGDSEGPGSLACCSSWGCRELDMTWCLNKNTGLWNILDELMLIKWYCWVINILLLFCYSCGKRCSKFQVFKFLCVNFVCLHALSYYPSTKEKVTLKIKFHQWW